MKVIDVYNEVKDKYPKYVIMIKVGNFYEVYNEDGVIVHNLLSYKVRSIGDNKRVGFPIVAYNKVTDCLNKNKINYIIVDGKIDVKKKFNKNRYDRFCYCEVDDRINDIYKRLIDKKSETCFKYLLDKIEELL
jgi:DNA mismatch repair ATPase MutS